MIQCAAFCFELIAGYISLTFILPPNGKFCKSRNPSESIIVMKLSQHPFEYCLTTCPSEYVV